MAETLDGVEDPALTWSGRAVDIGLIESELGKLRYMAAGEPAEEQGLARRTSLLNMVVYTELEETASYASQVIEDMATHHPSRALIVVGQPSEAESHIDAQLSAHCHITQNTDQTVCCEAVLLRVSGRAASHLHSLIVPLLIPDLPTYVWWTGPLPDDPHVLQSLLQTADRLIVDSSSFQDQRRDLQRFATIAAGEPLTGVGDLAWGRMSAWRQMLQIQREVSEMRHHLSGVLSVEVSYAAMPAGVPDGQALLFLGWLAGELGWDASSLSRGPSGEVTIAHGERAISLFLRAVPYPAIDDGWLVAFKIACESAQAPALLSVSRTGDPYHLTVRTEHKGDATESHVRIEKPAAPEVLLLELDAPAHDPGYRRALTMATLLAAALAES